MCLYNGMTPTVKTAIQFVHPVYLWVLVIDSSYSVINQLEFQTEQQVLLSICRVLTSLIHFSSSINYFIPNDCILLVLINKATYIVYCFKELAF